jgi:transposase InsO family protein
MPWKESTIMSQRLDFVTLAVKPGANVRELCGRFGISPRVGYKWIGRFKEYGPDGLADMSRRPAASPYQTDPIIEQLVLDLRDKHPAWGGRKLKRRLIDLGCQSIPAASTITEILRRNGRIDKSESMAHMPYIRFECGSPNELWQMDFKGWFYTDAGYCYPLTVLDDHSRYSIILEACANMRAVTVQEHLTRSFKTYGLPARMLMDHGSPWSGGAEVRYTPLTVWLIRLGIEINHGRVCHPQTQGKEERFHRTLKAEAIGARRFTDLPDCQDRFNQWREVYNHERPHEAIGMDTPASRYHMSSRSYPRELAPIEYGVQDHVRKVWYGGWFNFRGREYKVCKAFAGYPVGIRPTTTDGVFDVYFCHQKISQIDLTITDSGA